MRVNSRRVFLPNPEWLIKHVVAGIGPLSILATILVGGRDSGSSVLPYLALGLVFALPSVLTFWEAASNRLVVTDIGFSKHVMLAHIRVPWSSIQAVDMSEDGAIGLRIGSPYVEHSLLFGDREGTRDVKNVIVTDYIETWSTNGFSAEVLRNVPNLQVPERLMARRVGPFWQGPLTLGMAILVSFFLGLPIIVVLDRYGSLGLAGQVATFAWLSALISYGTAMLIAVGQQRFADSWKSVDSWVFGARIIAPVVAASIGVGVGQFWGQLGGVPVEPGQPQYRLVTMVAFSIGITWVMGQEAVMWVIGKYVGRRRL